MFATHQRRQKGLQAPSATDGQDTVPVFRSKGGPPGTETQGVVHTGAKSLPRAFATPKSDRLLARLQLSLGYELSASCQPVADVADTFGP